jgi:CHAT domain-containing protein
VYDPRNNLIAFGDPVYQGHHDPAEVRTGFSRLKYSEKEVTEIATLFEEGSAQLFLREEAKEDIIKEAGILIPFSYIHFATHGLMDEKNPENSSLVLSRETGGAEDGFLQAKEIALLEMDPDLVVLSACQTGLGKMVRGEGMIGLTRSFIYAGTPSVISSLWSVSDASTAELMLRFYENLIQRKLSKTDALRRAQITMITDGQYAHPFYWAPFILVGDWR